MTGVGGALAEAAAESATAAARVTRQAAEAASKQAADAAKLAAKNAAEQGTEAAKRAAAEAAKNAAATAKKASEAAAEEASILAKAVEGGESGLKGAAEAASKRAEELKRVADDLTSQSRMTDDLASQAETITKLTDDLKNAENARVAAKTPEEIAAASKRMTEIRKMMMQVVTVGGIIGTGIYLENKYNKADDDTKDCVKTCLPENWDGFEYGTLKKKELKFSTLPNTSDQPVCKQSMDDCGDYCDKKCTAIHEYKMPGSRAAEGLAGGLGGAAGGVAGSFFEAFNPFAGMSMFGEFTWLPFLISIMCIGIILVWGISKLR
jgi:hypothetical protein